MVALPSNFRRLIAASGLSNLADGVFQITLPLVALGITRDPGAFAAVTFVGRLPWLLVALPAGALADRLDRRTTMVRVNVARALLIGTLATVVAAGQEELWILYAVAFALGVGETLFDTAAQSIVPSMIGDPADLSRANGRLYAVELTANQFVGPPLGGFLAGVVLAGALFASAGAYAVAAIVLCLLVGSFRPARPDVRTHLARDIADGVAYLARHRLLRTLALCVGLSNLASTAMVAVLPLYAVDPGPMGLSGTGFAILLTSLAAGSLVGSFTVGWLEDAVGRRGALIVAVVWFPIISLAPAVSADAIVVGAMFFASGVFIIGWNVITVSLRQRIVPDHLLGRVNAGYRLLAWGTMPLGAALAGVIADRTGLRAVFWVSAAVSALCLPLVLTVLGDPALDGNGQPDADEPALDASPA